MLRYVKNSILLVGAGQNLALGAYVPGHVGVSNGHLVCKSDANEGAVIELPSARDRASPT